MKISIVDPKEPVDYSSRKTPSSYACGVCKKTGVKLWRDYGGMLSTQTLRCIGCAATEEGVSVRRMRPDGTHMQDGRMSTWIGRLIPAIPTDENDNFWTFWSIPARAWAWWKRLPNR